MAKESICVVFFDTDLDQVDQSSLLQNIHSAAVWYPTQTEQPNKWQLKQHLEKAHENNLVSNIAHVDYLEGDLGRLHLQPRDGLSTFVDDVCL